MGLILDPKFVIAIYVIIVPTATYNVINSKSSGIAFWPNQAISYDFQTMVTQSMGWLSVMKCG